MGEGQICQSVGHRGGVYFVGRKTLTIVLNEHFVLIRKKDTNYGCESLYSMGRLMKNVYMVNFNNRLAI